MFSLPLYALFGILEFILIVVVLLAVVLFKWRSAVRDAEALRRQLDESKQTPIPPAASSPTADNNEPAADYAEHLRKQIEASSLLLGESRDGSVAIDAAAPKPDDDSHLRQMLAIRHQFLQMELDTQNLAMEEDAQAQRQHIAASVQALLEGLNLQADAGTGGDATAEEADSPAGESASVSRSEITQLQDQIAALRRVIDNQHESMRELRALLSEHGGDSAELQAALKKLGAADAQAIEMMRCLEVVERENERLKQLDHAVLAAEPARDDDSLRDLVENQQRTIGELQDMLKAALPAGESTAELDKAIDKIQRTNNELNSCVMVLEDENNMLRDEVDTLHTQVTELEALVNHQNQDEASAPLITDVIDAPIETEREGGEQGVVTDASVATDDIDALLAAAQPQAATAAEAAAVDPDDIDALLASAAVKPDAEPVTADSASAATPAPDAPVAADDIDALLAAATPAPSAGAPETDLTDIDIDALLDAVEPVRQAQDAVNAAAADELPENNSKAVESAAKAKALESTKQDETDALLAELFGDKPSR